MTGQSTRTLVQPRRWDGPSYPEPGIDLVPPTHSLADIPVICRVHLGEQYTEGFRWEILRCQQPDGDGPLGWAFVNDDCYRPIVREGDEIRTLSASSGFTTDHLKELRR